MDRREMVRKSLLAFVGLAVTATVAMPSKPAEAQYYGNRGGGFGGAANRRFERRRRRLARRMVRRG